MSYTLSSAKLKWDRANQQLNALNVEIAEFMQSAEKPYKISLKRNSQTGEDCILINIVKKTPIMWSVKIGEIIYNLRSALDHMVYEIASLNCNGTVPARTEFPIFIDEVRFRSEKMGGGMYKMRGLPENVRTSIEEIQPFKREQSPELHRLWALQELSNWDKHRLLHLTSVTTGTRNLSLKTEGGVTIKATKVRADGEIEDGAELCCYQVTQLSANGQVHMDGDIIYSVAFDKTGPGNGSLVSEGLKQLVDCVAEVGALLRNPP